MSWIFGYGSLVWRPAFPAIAQRPAAIHGWTRRFWQGSADHRGTPEAPGRVVTLVEDPDGITWGMAYRVAAGERAAILAALDHREKDGYDRLELALDWGEGPSEDRALVYVAGPSNPHFLGPAPLDRIAEQVRASVGPSGANLEYVVRLAEALRAIGRPDPHVEAVAAAAQA